MYITWIVPTHNDSIFHAAANSLMAIKCKVQGVLRSTTNKEIKKPDQLNKLDPKLPKIGPT